MSLKNWTVKTKQIKNSISGLRKHKNYLMSKKVSSHLDTMISDVGKIDAQFINIKQQVRLAEKQKGKETRGRKKSSFATSFMISLPADIQPTTDQWQAIGLDIIVAIAKELQEYREPLRDEDGKVIKEPVLDSKGNQKHRKVKDKETGKFVSVPHFRTVYSDEKPFSDITAQDIWKSSLNVIHDERHKEKGCSHYNLTVSNFIKGMFIKPMTQYRITNTVKKAHNDAVLRHLGISNATYEPEQENVQNKPLQEARAEKRILQNQELPFEERKSLIDSVKSYFDKWLGYLMKGDKKAAEVASDFVVDKLVEVEEKVNVEPYIADAESYEEQFEAPEPAKITKKYEKKTKRVRKSKNYKNGSKRAAAIRKAQKNKI